MSFIRISREDWSKYNILKSIIFGTSDGTYYMEISYNADDLPTNGTVWTDNTKTTVIGSFTITYNSKQLPTQIEFTIEGKTITNTFTYDTNDNVTSITQTEV